MSAEKKAWPDPKYIVNDEGEPVEVILSIEEYRELRDQYEDEADAALLDKLRETETEFRPWRKVRDEIESSQAQP